MTDRFEVAVLLFGQHRELAGESVVTVELDAGGTVADLKRAVAAHLSPRISLEGVAVALNRTYQPDEFPVARGDEVAIIPPVAGG